MVESNKNLEEAISHINNLEDRVSILEKLVMNLLGDTATPEKMDQIVQEDAAEIRPRNTGNTEYYAIWPRRTKEADPEKYHTFAPSIIMELNFGEGDAVAVGDPLFTVYGGEGQISGVLSVLGISFAKAVHTGLITETLKDSVNQQYQKVVVKAEVNGVVHHDTSTLKEFFQFNEHLSSLANAGKIYCSKPELNAYNVSKHPVCTITPAE